VNDTSMLEDYEEPKDTQNGYEKPKKKKR